jgi:hypothetical protein
MGTYGKIATKIGLSVARHLSRSRHADLNFVLHCSNNEQRKRLPEAFALIDRKNLESTADFHERPFWDNYRGAYERPQRATA